MLFYFRAGIYRGLSSSSSIIFHPILTLGNNLGGKFYGVFSFFASKNSLQRENENLKKELDTQKASMSNYNSILEENINMKEILGRKNEKTSMVLAAILSKPSQSIYDTLVIDAGSRQAVKTGDLVFAEGNVPIGRISLVYPFSSKVVLFSSAGENTEVIVSGKNIFMQAVGRGGGNFEMILPRELTLEKGAEVVLPGINSYVLGVVQAIVSDPRDSFQKALLSSPVNIFELKFVEVAQ